jgi:flagellar protein FliO/FliZ
MPACALGLLALALIEPTLAAADAYKRDTTPLPQDVISGTGASATTHAASGGSAVLRLVIGLAVVLGLIFIVRWGVKRARREPRPGRGSSDITVISTTPLAGTRAVHLLLVGEELLLVGSAEHSVTALRVYTNEEARALLEPGNGGQPLSLHPSPTPAVPTVGKLLEDLRRRTAR